MGGTGQLGVTNTNFGVAWVSKSGLYLSTGETPVNLMLEKISYSDLIEFYDTGSFGPVIGYDSSANKILVSDDVDDQTEIRMFDIFSKTWTNGNSLDSTAGWGIHGGADTSITNMVTFTGNEILTSGGITINRNGGLLVYADEDTGEDGDSDLFSISLGSTVASPFAIATKDEDFGAPNAFKKIYEVNVEYLTDNTSDAIDVLYEIDGNDTPYNGSNSLVTNQTLSGNSSKDNVNMLNIKPSSPIKCRSISIRIQSNGNSSALLKIISIGIRYRIIGSSSVDTETSSS